MESPFVELANTDLSDSIFFEEVFLQYLHYLYPASKKKCIDALSQIREKFKQKDGHTLYHLRDKIESVLYRYHQIEKSVLVAEQIQMKRRIDELEKIVGLNKDL